MVVYSCASYTQKDLIPYLIWFPRMLRVSRLTFSFPLTVIFTAFKCVFIATSTPDREWADLATKWLTIYSPLNNCAVFQFNGHGFVANLHQKANELHGGEVQDGVCPDALCAWLFSTLVQKQNEQSGGATWGRAARQEPCGGLLALFFHCLICVFYWLGSAQTLAKRLDADKCRSRFWTSTIPLAVAL